LLLQSIFFNRLLKMRKSSAFRSIPFNSATQPWDSDNLWRKWPLLWVSPYYRRIPQYTNVGVVYASAIRQTATSFWVSVLV